MKKTNINAIWDNFLGQSPDWYKKTILVFLIINPIIFFLVDQTLAGWLIVLEFIFTLAMALKCYPLQPGGLLAIEAIVIGMTTPSGVRAELFSQFPVILLLMFMVAGIYFMKDLLLYTFTKIVLNVQSKTTVAFLFCITSAVLSAFLDALTVTAVIISVTVGFYSVYHKVASGGHYHQDDRDHTQDLSVGEDHASDLEKFRAFLRNLLMHAAIGTALGGVCTIVGEPQNLLIAGKLEWEFIEFFMRMAPVTLPVLIAGLATCIILEKTGWFGYGALLPVSVRHILEDFDKDETGNRTKEEKMQLVVQAIAAAILVIALAFHWTEVGLIGLMVIVLQTAFNGVTEEHQIGRAFEEALPFTSLLVVFFVMVSVIHDQHLFNPIIDYALSLDLAVQPSVFYIANGLLSMISDNVFVATVYINEVERVYLANDISRDHYEIGAIAINTGTNLPSVATPNGQAAFLFLLTSSIAPLVRLSYMRMVIMALPYTVVMGLVGFIGITWFL